MKHQLITEFKDCKGFSDKLLQENKHIWEKIDKHPFFNEIESGSLPREKYKTYAIQNYYYFIEWFRCCAAAGTKASTSSEVLKYKRWATDTESEFNKYVAIIKNFGITDKELLQVETDPTIPLPAARAYVDYSYKIYSTGSPGEMAAAILPCAWTYAPRDIGGLACPLRVATGLANHYGVNREIALDYGNYANQKEQYRHLISLKNTINENAKTGKEVVDRIKDVFCRCSEYEYTWWDIGYRHDPKKKRETGSPY